MAEAIRAFLQDNPMIIVCLGWVACVTEWLP